MAPKRVQRRGTAAGGSKAWETGLTSAPCEEVCEIMAGVVAMASVIEDFETQPCKKSRKDGDSPTVKTITNYFSPMPKEKPFSPPKSNNIMDYFSRKTPPVREKGNTLEQPKENRHRPQPSEAPGHPETTERQHKQPQKRGRKPSKATKQLQKVYSTDSTEDCVICEGPIDEGDSADNAVRSFGVLGSDTAALLAQISADMAVWLTCVAGESDGDDIEIISAEKAQNNKHHEGDLKGGPPVKQKQGETCDGSFPKVPPRDKVKRGRPKGSKNKKHNPNLKGQAKQQQVEERECVSEVKEAELSLCDASMEVNVDEASRLNGSTITISFEDFLQSQGENEGESIVNLDPEEKEVGLLDVPNASEKRGPEEPPCPQQVSPRTLTIRADVHAVSHKHEPVRAVEKKMSSIFTKRKEEESAAEVKPASSPYPQVRPELLPTPKRKSNVVLQEEDPELDIVESDSTPKCTQVERKPFMSAFKQASVDGAKAKPGKSQGKQKQPSEKDSAEAVDEADEKAPISVPEAVQPDADSAGGKIAKKKPGRRGRKKVQEEKSVPSPATQEEPVPMETNEGSDAKATEEPTPTSTPTVRRSKRDVSLRQTPVTESETVTPALKTKSQGRTKAVQMSTPKTPRSKHRVFMAEVLCPADEKESPIRFTRVYSNSKSEGGSDFEILSPVKRSNASKKRKQAKKLVEKARAIQQSKKAAAEERESLRRSSRSQSSTKKSYCEDEVYSTDSTEDCVICEGPIDEGDSADNAVRSVGVLGSDTAALLAQISAEVAVWLTCVAGESDGDDIEIISAEKAQNNKHHEGDLKGGPPVKQKQGETCDGSFPKVPPRDKVKRGRPKGSKNKKHNPNLKGQAKQQQVEERECVSEVKEAELSLCDASMEVNVDEASRLNGSTITISFEDFLQSQGENEGESIVNLDPEEKEVGLLDVPNASEKRGPEEPPCPQQVSPRTLTIRADVHAVSHKHEPVRAVEKKMSSIFTKRKEEESAAEVKPASSPYPQVRPELLPTPRRKSNVVLQEEDLEIDVVESDSTPKCTQVERKPGKSQGKQKQPSEKDSAEAGEKAPISVPEAVQPDADSAGGKIAKKKPGRRGRKKVQEEKSVPSPATQEEPVPMETNEGSDAKTTEEPTPTSTPTVRRSKRDVSLRQTPVTESETVTPALKTKSQGRTKDVQMSTPKTPRSKHRVFMAEVLCPADEKDSPIRCTRVYSNSKSEGGSDFEILSPVKRSNASKKRKQAKKLVEKARAIQQSKKAAAEERESLRRSSRSQSSTKKSYCEDEDSVVFLAAQAAQEKGKPQKRLRSMKEVLGRNVAKEGKNPAAPKKAQKTAVISIFDESSHEGSENSQDNEQFRARKEFLKSGLPDSFKKQIAKSAATKDAYTVSCSSVQPLVHVLQTPQDCPLWSLPWPVSQLLQCLKKLRCLPSNPLPSLDGLSCCTTVSASRVDSERGSGWREEFSEPIREFLMGEISASNPPFPVQRYLTRFLKRRTDHLIQCTTSEPDPVTRVPSAPVSAEAVGEKRKRVDEGEVPGKVAKKQRSSKLSEEKTIVITDHPGIKPTGDTSTPPLPRRGGRKSRAQRCKEEEEEEEEEAKPSVENTPLSPQSDCVVLLEDSPLAENSGKEDLVKEDVLWTEKYQPQHSSDVIGNTGSVRRLHSWLKEWKLRADREEGKKQKEKKQEEGSNDSWDCEEGDAQEGEDLMCNTLLITGPTGVGKTAAVYACALELGFKVFEVNASSQRTGRQILSQLKEATQSHQVDVQGVSSSSSSVRPGISPRKVNSPRRVVSSPRKAPQSPRGPKRGGLAPTSLASYFKMGRPTNKEPGNQDKKQQTADPKKTTKAKESSVKTKTKDPPKEPPATRKESSSEEQGKKAATSLILFEEVDVIFDDDSGFLAAIKTFMTTTKRPVILTTSDPTFSAMFDGYLEEIHFKAPSVVNVVSYLQLLCLAENMRTDPRDVSSLLSLNRGDIRHSLLHLQFWTRSAGGCQLPRPTPDSAPTAMALQLKTEGSGEAVEAGSVCEGAIPTPLPPCDTGCTESLLGLLNIEPERDVYDLLRSQSTVEQGCLELLTESRRSGVDLLYSNMAALLPLPVTDLTITACRPTQEVVNRTQEEPSTEPREVVSMGPQTESQQQTDPLAHPVLLQVAEGSEDGSPVKVSSRMKRKKQHCLDSDSDSDDAFLSLPKPQSSPPTASQSEDNTTDKEEGPQTGKEVAQASVPVPVRTRRVPLTPEQRMKSEPVSRCLGSLAEFLDHMSFLDASLLSQTPHTGGARETHVFGLTGRSETKDGMTDEPREGCDGGSWAEGVRAVEIQASVEALSFERCRTGVAEAWARAQALEGELGKEAVMELTLPVAQHRQAFSLTQDSPCEPKVLQRRREVIDTLLSSRGFGTLGNRPAVAVDYLPSLRAICRAETLKEQGKVKRRFLHYLDSIHLGIPKSAVRHLAEDFP